jgi:hypothetical protein
MTTSPTRQLLTTPAIAIRNEVWVLIEAQIETFGQSSRLTPAELSEFSYRAFRIRKLGEELDRINGTVILERRFGRAA